MIGILLSEFKRKRMDHKKTKKEKEEQQRLIEKLLGTNDCGDEGIGVMIIGSTFYVGERHIFSNEIKKN